MTIQEEKVGASEGESTEELRTWIGGLVLLLHKHPPQKVERSEEGDTNDPCILAPEVKEYISKHKDSVEFMELSATLLLLFLNRDELLAALDDTEEKSEKPHENE